MVEAVRESWRYDLVVAVVQMGMDERVRERVKGLKVFGEQRGDENVKVVSKERCLRGMVRSIDGDIEVVVEVTLSCTLFVDAVDEVEHMGLGVVVGWNMFVDVVVMVGRIHKSCLCLYLYLCPALCFQDLSTVQRTVQRGREVVHHSNLKIEVEVEVEIEVGCDNVLVLERNCMGKDFGSFGSFGSFESVRHEEVVDRKRAESYMRGGIGVVVSSIGDGEYRTPFLRDVDTALHSNNI